VNCSLTTYKSFMLNHCLSADHRAVRFCLIGDFNLPLLKSYRLSTSGQVNSRAETRELEGQLAQLDPGSGILR